MVTAEDETFLRRALRLAMHGRGHVEPNPMVGCVLVKNGQIIGEGWHQKVGEAHAEPNAISDCRARGHSPSGATAYVTLEPCCHTNKRTPPCAPRLIQANIARVVIGCLDPNPDVNGRGVAMLRAAGIAVDVLPEAEKPAEDAHGWPSVGVRPLDASVFRQLIAPFILRQNANRSYITTKWAETADRRVADEGGAPLQISNAASNFFVHQLRAREQYILVGANTVLADDPLLNVRHLQPSRLVFRTVLDPHLRVRPEAKIVTSAMDESAHALTWIATTQRAIDAKPERRHALGRFHVRCFAAPEDEKGRIDLVALANSQPEHGYFVEAGPTLARAFFEADVCDRLIVIRSPNALGKSLGVPTAAPIPSHFIEAATIDLAGDTLTEYLNTRSPAFFAAVPSADFVLAAESAARAAN